MKFKSLFLTIIISIFFINNFSYIINDEVVIKVPKEEIKKNKLEFKEELRSLEETKRFKKDLENENIKYIAIQKPAIGYQSSVFYAADYFYLGANDAGAQDYSLLKAKINQGATPATNSLTFVALAPAQVYLNGIKEDDKIVKKANPIYDKRIDKMALLGRYPILTSQDTTSVFGVSDLGAGKRICLIDNITDGSSVKTNEIEINDSNNNSTDGVVGLEKISNEIIAAVKSNAGSFGDGNGGFALLIQKDSKLKPINAQTGDEEGNLAFKLDISSGNLFAISQSADTGVTLGDMYWDSNSGRLFIGLVGAKRSNFAANGGAVSILVARLDEDKILKVESVLNLDSSLFTDNSSNHVLGFYSTNATDLITNCYKLRTMQTSTGKNYLIVNGATSTTDNKNKIYAFPVLGTKKSDGTSVADSNIGKIADKNDINHDTVVQNNAGMYLATQDEVKVGAGAFPIPVTADVQDMFVVNDSVFVCVSEDRSDATHESGIFRSTAIFDQNGNIRAWTPWQRVMGNIDKVYGAGFDINTGNYWYFTENASNVKNTVKVSQWGKGSSQAGLMGNGLVEILSDEFKQSNAGVHQMFNFDETTPGIARTDVANKVSFMAALGYKKVALIETGANSGGAFTPTQNQFIKDTNVFVIQDQTLNNLGPVCVAEISRIQEENKGWLFVGGYNGVAVWRNPTNGNGWDGRLNQPKIDFSDLIDNKNFSFKEIGNYSNVRKLVARGNFLYVMTVDNIYRFKMASNKFDDAVTAALDSKRISPPTGHLLDMIIFYGDTGDVRLLVATTQGLFYSDSINNTNEDKTGAKAPSWTKVALNSGALLSNPVTHLSFIDVQKGGYTSDGNLYVLSADLSLNLATLYRFNIKNGNIYTIPENSDTDYFYSFGELRTNFLTDGALGFSMLSKHFGQTEFLRQIRMVFNKTTIRLFENSINIDLENNAHNVGIMIQNTASGGWVIPGDWGMRVNE
ncbi:hypothetical protein GF385_00295 [Candidatus Dependentiae bacterium]|nr:hypothetical protein [Candidatus Dependentiae bacterium]